MNKHMNNLEAIVSERKSGDEPFHKNGTSVNGRLLSFWQWSSSELVGNTLRGVVAEYLVATDLGCVSDVRQEWDAYDIETLEGIKVEVKSGAYLQSWSQKKLSSIQFGIKPTYGWDAKSNIISEEKYRQSDIYVFCVLSHKDKSTVDPLNVAQWEFYVLSTSVLNIEVGEQETISLSSLLRLKPIQVKYGEIGNAIKITLT